MPIIPTNDLLSSSHADIDKNLDNLDSSTEPVVEEGIPGSTQSLPSANSTDRVPTWRPNLASILPNEPLELASTPDVLPLWSADKLQITVNLLMCKVCQVAKDSDDNNWEECEFGEQSDNVLHTCMKCKARGSGHQCYLDMSSEEAAVPERKPGLNDLLKIKRGALRTRGPQWSRTKQTARKSTTPYGRPTAEIAGSQTTSVVKTSSSLPKLK